MIKVVVAGVSELLCFGLRHCLLETPQVGPVEIVRAERALIELLRDSSLPDLVLLDAQLSPNGPAHVVSRLAQDFPSIRILVFGDEQQWGDAVSLLRCGAFGVVSSNDSSETFRSAVLQVAAGRPFVNQELAAQLAMTLTPPAPSNHMALSPREFQVFKMLADGVSVSEIAAGLGLSVKTVSTHKTRLMQRMQFSSLSELVQYALEHGLLRRRPWQSRAFTATTPGCPGTGRTAADMQARALPPKRPEQLVFPQ